MCAPVCVALAGVRIEVGDPNGTDPRWVAAPVSELRGARACSIVHKRLERGTFTFAERLRGDAKAVEIDVHELSMLLEGIDVERSRVAPRWEPPFDARNSQF